MEIMSGPWAMPSSFPPRAIGEDGLPAIFFLQQGALEKAIPHFSYILTHYPNQGALVYEVWKKVVDDPDFAVDHLLPRDSSALKHYLSYVYDAGDKESAARAWEKKAAFGFTPDASETLRHIDFLISRGAISEAFRTLEGQAARRRGFPLRRQFDHRWGV